MRAQSAVRYSFLVYIFQDDVKEMIGNPDQTWNLYGLWTHSSSPVVQYICKEGRHSSDVQRWGLELLGQFTPQRKRERTSRPGPWLAVYTNGAELEAQLLQRTDRSPARCSVKVLRGVSPFSSQQHQSPSGHVTEADFRSTAERNDHVDKRMERQSAVQWYSTSEGEKILRNIYNYCISNFSSPSRVDMSRDFESHNFQISIEHNSKTFNIYFPNDFPQSSAHIVCISVAGKNMLLTDTNAKCKEDIVSIVKNKCGCYRCKYE